jgi:hypothetical protein
MGSTVAFIVAGLALAGALASWVYGAYLYVAALRVTKPQRGRLLVGISSLGWIFQLRRLKSVAGGYAQSINKALVSFFACLMVAAAAMSVATNLSRVAR